MVENFHCHFLNMSGRSKKILFVICGIKSLLFVICRVKNYNTRAVLGKKWWMWTLYVLTNQSLNDECGVICVSKKNNRIGAKSWTWPKVKKKKHTTRIFLTVLHWDTAVNFFLLATGWSGEGWISRREVGGKNENGIAKKLS